MLGIVQTGPWVADFVVKHHKAFDIGTRIVAACAFAHTMLPPWDWDPDFIKNGLKEFPTAQKTFRGAFNNRYYRLLVYLVGFIGLHARSTLWRSISVNNPDGPNANNPTPKANGG